MHHYLAMQSLPILYLCVTHSRSSKTWCLYHLVGIMVVKNGNPLSLLFQSPFNGFKITVTSSYTTSLQIVFHIHPYIKNTNTSTNNLRVFFISLSSPSLLQCIISGPSLLLLKMFCLPSNLSHPRQHFF